MKIMDSFWPWLKNNSEDLNTGIIVLLSFIKMKIASDSFHRFCQIIKVRQSSIYNATNTHIVSKLSDKTFKGFEKSSELIRELLDKQTVTLNT